MSFLQGADAVGAAGELCDRHRAADGSVPNSVQAFALRPEVYDAWEQLKAAVCAPDLRRYELATLGAAVARRSSYCSLAHGALLAERFLPAEVVRDLVTDLDRAAVDEQERAVVAFAAKVAGAADRVEAADVQRLRELGLDDAAVLDVVLAAAARCFFSTVLDATGTLADGSYAQLQPAELRDALTVGRPISGA